MLKLYKVFSIHKFAILFHKYQLQTQEGTLKDYTKTKIEITQKTYDFKLVKTHMDDTHQFFTTQMDNHISLETFQTHRN